MAEPDARATGVLLMAYGSPAGPDEIEAYYTHIRRGRPPSPEQLADLRRRYAAIGGVSPLAERSRAQAAGVQAVLGDGYRVALGLKHAHPFIEDAVEELAGAGCHEAVALVLAPHGSPASTGEYFERAMDAGGAQGVRVRKAGAWHLDPGLIGLLARRVREARAALDQTSELETVFTAHSLPARVVESGDPYPRLVQETAEAVASAVGLAGFRVAWQSAGRTDEQWLGPDLLEVLPSLPAGGADAVVVCPVGFVADHLEVLYDIDVDARRVAEGCGLRLVRTGSLNDDPAFLAVLAGAVRRA